MKKTTLFLLILLQLVAMSSLALADLTVGDLAKPSQLKGYWKMEEWPANVKNKFNRIPDPWPYRFQWFVYSTENRMYHLTYTAHPNFEITPQYLRDYYEKGQSSLQYQAKDGFVWVYSGGVLREVWRVRIAGSAWQGEGINVKRGDLIMSLLNSRGQEVFYRQLRRI